MTGWRRRHLAVALLLLLVGRASPARAQDAAAAEALFREGRALMARGEYALACSKLAESQRIDPSSGTLLNLASCHQKQGKTATAWAEFLAAARLARTQGNLERADVAKANAAAIEPELSYLTIIVADEVPGLQVKRGSVVLEAKSLGSRLPVDPGDHELIVTAPGYAPRRYSVTIDAKGDAKTIHVPALEKIEEPSRTPSGTVAKAARPERRPTGAGRDAGDEPGASPILGYVVAGAGVATLAVGATFGVMALSSYDNADDSCPSHDACSTSAMEERERASSRATIANIGIGLGAVVTGVGIVLIVARGSEESAGHSTRSKGNARLAVGALGPEGAGAVLSGAF